MDFRELSLRELARLVQTKEVSARELVEHALTQIALWDDLHAWVTIDEERARADARAVDEAIARGYAVGPLAGVPLGVKDLEDASGLRTTYGSALHETDAPATSDSLLVGRLRRAGCIVIGKTATPEYGWTGDTISAVSGATLNPYDRARSPGGSSGGSAAALAAGMVPLATGSDGGGSIRGPAAICGLTGLKPTHGLIALGGTQPPGGQLLTVRGPMSIRAADIAFALSCCVGSDPSDPFSVPLPPYEWSCDPELPSRVVWCPSSSFPVDRAVAAACAEAIERLAMAGTEVIEIEQLFADPPLAHWWTIWTALRNRAQGHLRGTPEWERIDPGLRATMDHAETSVTATSLLEAYDYIHHVNGEVEKALSQAPYVLTPTQASETALSGHLGAVDGEETPFWLPFTQVYNMTRHPAGSVPCGTNAAGLPVGMQVATARFGDARLLRAMAAMEELWADLCPPRPGR